MHKPKRILIISDGSYSPAKMFLDLTNKVAKGFIRLGHDVRTFNYRRALFYLSPIKSKTFSRRFFKSRVDKLLATQIKNYKPDITIVCFPKLLDGDTIACMRQSAPDAVCIGWDGDPWPKLQKHNKIETAKKLDMVMATNDGKFLQDYKEAGVPLSAFMPNVCDPDVDHRYEVGPEWNTNILWTGSTKHHAGTSDTLREELVLKLAQRDDCSLYGCLGHPKIGGIDYLYAISGARIGVNANSCRPVRLYSSDRLTHYLACGTFVLAERIPDGDLLFQDAHHLRYFDSVDEFFDLADWYLNHEAKRKEMADAGMKWVHEQLNSVKVAGYILELIQTGSYSAPWTS